MRLRKKMIFGWGMILCVLICYRAYGAQQDISISVDKKEIVLGDTITFSIRLSKGEIQPPTIPSTKNLNIQYLGSQKESFSSFQLVINGRNVQSNRSGGGVRYNYRIIPKQSGVFTFPSIDIPYKNGVYRTNPFEIKVIDQTQTSDDIFVVQELSDTEVFLGEKVKYSFKWYFNKDIEGYDCSIPALQELKNFVWQDIPHDDDRQYHRFVINGTEEVLVRKTSEVHQGKQYAVITLEKVLVPLSSGEFQLDPALLRCDVVKAYQRGRRSSFFDDFFSSDFDSFFGFGRRAITEPFVTRSAPIRLRVRDLPSQEKPEHFSNAIGDFIFKAEVNTQAVKKGEPITLSMRVIGEGNLEQIEMPHVPQMEMFRSYEPEIKVVERKMNGRDVAMKIFEKVFIPTRAGEFEIPEITFTYFDTDTKQYKSIQQGPFKISVKESAYQEKPITVFDTEGETARQKEQIELKERDIHYIKTDMGTVTRHAKPPYRNIPLIILFFCGPVLLVIVFNVYATKKMRMDTDETFARRSVAYKNMRIALKGLKKEIAGNDKEFYFDSVRALNTYLCSKMGLPQGSVSDEIIDQLKRQGISNEIIDQITHMYERADQIKFSGLSKIDNAEKQKRAVIDTIHTIIQYIEKKVKV